MHTVGAELHLKMTRPCNTGTGLHHWQDADSFQVANDGLENNEVREHMKFLSFCIRQSRTVTP